MIFRSVILAAGKGARLCPITPFLPKEMLPIGGFPAIHHLVSELGCAGIKEHMIVLSTGKESIRDYLTQEISPKGDVAVSLSEKRRELLSGMRFHFVEQKSLRGTADAIRLAKEFTGNEPIFVAYPDDLLSLPDRNDGSEVIRDMIRIACETGKSVLLAEEIPVALSSQYGVLSMGVASGKDVCSVTGIVEKPKDYRGEKAYAMIGRMVITPSVMDAIESFPINDADGITPALSAEAGEGRVLAKLYRGRRYDLGSHRGYEEVLREMIKTKEGTDSEAIYGKRIMSDLPS